MSVWKSDEKLFIFAPLISPGKILLFEKYYQAFDKVFHLVKKHAKIVKNTPLRVVFFDSLLRDETLRLMFDMLPIKNFI